MRVSGGHLCAEHRSTDRGGSRDFEPAKALLRCPKFVARYSHRRISTAAPRRHKLHIICFRANTKTHSFRCSSSSQKVLRTFREPCITRFFSHRERFGDDAPGYTRRLQSYETKKYPPFGEYFRSGCGDRI